MRIWTTFQNNDCEVTKETVLVPDLFCCYCFIMPARMLKIRELMEKLIFFTGLLLIFIWS